MKSKDNTLTIVIPTIIFSGYTGVELYVYELSKELAARGHRVIVVAPDPSGDIVERTKGNGVEVYSFESCPDDITPDVLHLNEQLPSMLALAKWVSTPAVATIHSQFSVERPFVSDRINTYICIRPEIVEHIRQHYPKIASKSRLIHNGFDFKRFKGSAQEIGDENGKKTILFVGTIDTIRKASIEHLIKKCAEEGLILRVVGKRYEDYLDNPPSHVEVLPPRWEVEELFTSDVIATAGVLLGRSTIEGWIAGRPGWIYDIETNGDIRSFEQHEIPADIEKFDIKNVTNELVDIYNEAILTHSDIPGEALQNDLAAISAILTERSLVSGNSIYLIIKKNDYLEGIISDNCQKIDRLNVQLEEVKKELDRVHHRVHYVERYSPKNIKRKLKSIAANTTKRHRDGTHE